MCTNLQVTCIFVLVAKLSTAITPLIICLVCSLFCVAEVIFCFATFGLDNVVYIDRYIQFPSKL